MARLVASLVALLTLGTVAPRALAAESAPPPSAPAEVRLAVGELYLVCKSGELLCPATAPRCDDPGVAVPELTPRDGLAWKGVGKGTTLCSAGAPGAAAGGGPRRVFRVTVR